MRWCQFSRLHSAMMARTFLKFVIVVAMAQVARGYLNYSALNGQHLKIATVTMLPYMIVHHDAEGRISGADGMVYQMVIWLSRRFNFTYTFVEPPDGTFGSLVNNTWTGMVRMAMEHEVDLIAAPLTPTAERAKVIQFAYCFAQDPLALLMPAPTADNKLAAIVKPFKAEVWFLLIFSMFVVSIAIWLAINFSYKYLPSYDTVSDVDKSFSQQLMFTLRILTCQAQGFTINTAHSTRVIAATWCLTAVVFVYLYSGCLTSFITVPKLYPAVNSMEELATTNKIQLLVYKDTFFEAYLKASESGTYKLLADSIRRQPENKLQFDDGTIGVEKVASGKYGLTFEKSFLESLIESDLKKTGECRLSLLKQEFFMARECFAFPKGSPLGDLINNGVETMEATGLLDRWHSVYWTPPNRCTINKQEHPKTVLSLFNLVGAFVLLLAGLVITTIIFVSELGSLAFLKKRG